MAGSACEWEVENLGVMSGLGWIVGTFVFTSRFLTLAEITPSSFRSLTS